MTKQLHIVLVCLILLKVLFLSHEARAQETNSIPSKYSYLDPQKLIRSKALALALNFFDLHKDRFKNKNFIAVIDYSKKSTENRFHILDMNSGLVTSVHVSHGRGSDKDHTGQANYFSNLPKSNATSLGFFVTGETYAGSHGYSLKLDGLSETNSKARERAIVIHGAEYVKDQDVIQGRSWGCPAVSIAQRDQVINSLKGGSLIFATGN